ncbi:hypothetical protein ACFWPK_22390 [Nocardia sp. NPDC058519]|uniref:hypothetical protein n=1 Tax=Nocardia sp. NPDC058519 TaxID=3346535 RepID=UPI00365231C0
MWPGETWTFERPGEKDRNGDRLPDTTLTVEGCVFWTEGESIEDFGRDTRISRGLLSVPSSEGIKETDRPKSPAGERFQIVGRERWGGPHPLTGYDFGEEVFRVKGVT